MKVYRFRELVAVNPPTGDGPTFYLDPEEAAALANALYLVAFDCKSRRFTDSQIGEIDIHQEGVSQ